MEPLRLITYLRTDSTRVAEEADAGGKSLYRYKNTTVRSMFPKVKHLQRIGGAKIQDAHEAIRPTDITLTPAMCKGFSPKRPVPPVSADLEAFYRKPHGAGDL